MPRLVSLALSLLDPQPVAPEALPIATPDAPDQSNGTFTVAPGAWQLEVGLDADLPGSRSGRDELPLRIPTSLRVGLTPRVELRAFDGERLFHRDAQGDARGETAFGFKIRLNDLRPGTRRPSFGLQPYVSLATVALLHNTESIATGVTLLWTQHLTRWLTVDTNLGAEVGVGLARMPVSTFASSSWQIIASSRWVPFAEIYAEVPWSNIADLDLGADAGIVMHISRRVAFDVAGRVGLLSANRAYSLVGGLAVLLADGRRYREWRHRTEVTRQGGAPRRRRPT